MLSMERRAACACAFLHFLQLLSPSPHERESTRYTVCESTERHEKRHEMLRPACRVHSLYCKHSLYCNVEVVGGGGQCGARDARLARQV